MINLLSIGDNFRQTLETCDSKKIDMHTQKHIRLMYCASTPPLSSFVFVCFRFEPKVSCQTVKHTSLQLLESGKGCWQQRFNPFSICKSNILRFPYLWALIGSDRECCRCERESKPDPSLLKDQLQHIFFALYYNAVLVWVWHAKWKFIAHGVNHCETTTLTCKLENTKADLLRFPSPRSLRLFSFSNPKFHLKLSNTHFSTTTYTWRWQELLKATFFVRFVFARQHSKVSVLVGAHWERSWQVMPLWLST